MNFKKDEIVYYFIKYKDSQLPGIVRLKSERDQSSPHGLSCLFKIENILTSQYVGFKTRIIVGYSISANELQGVGVSGADKYFFSFIELMKKLIKESMNPLDFFERKNLFEELFE